METDAMIEDPVALAGAFGFLGDPKISASSVMQQHQQQQHQQQQQQEQQQQSYNGPITRGTWYKSLKKASALSACLRLSAVIQLEDEISILREVLCLHEEKREIMTSLDAVLEVVNNLRLTKSDIEEDLRKMVIRGQIDLQDNGTKRKILQKRVLRTLRHRHKMIMDEYPVRKELEGLVAVVRSLMTINHGETTTKKKSISAAVSATT